jgi:hypothetical protein
VAVAMDERSDRGPVVGIPMTWREFRFLADWCQVRPAVRATVESALVVLDLRYQDAIGMADILSRDLPVVASTFRAALEDPVYVSSLTQEERTVIARVRRTAQGRLSLDIDHGVPTVVPERHWRWHSGGVRGYMAERVTEVVMMAAGTMRRANPDPEPDWQATVQALADIGRGARDMAEAVERVMPNIEAIMRAVPRLEAAEAAMAQLDVIRQVLDTRLDPTPPDRPTDAPTPAPAPPARTVRPRGRMLAARERILACIGRVAGEDGIFRQPALWRLLAQDPAGALPRTTMITVLGRLASEGVVERVATEAGTWRLLARSG